MEEGLGAVARCGRDDSKQCRAALLRRRCRTGVPAWWRSVAMVRRRGAPPRFLPWRGGGRAPSSSSCAWCRILLAWRDDGFMLLLPFLVSPPGFSPSSLAWSASSVSRWWRRRRRLGRRGRRLGFAASDWALNRAGARVWRGWGHRNGGDLRCPCHGHAAGSSGSASGARGAGRGRSRS